MENKNEVEFFQRIFYYLTPPGEGVFKNFRCEYYKKKIWEGYFGESSLSKVEKIWRTQLMYFFKKHADRVFLLAIPSDVGAGVQRGANLGPIFLRLQLVDFFKKRLFGDFGDIRVVPQLLMDEYLSESIIGKVKKVLYGNEKIKLPVSPLSIADDFTKNLFELCPEAKVFVLGGDHSISYPLIKNWLLARRRRNIRTAVVVFDAHPDLASERLGVEISYTSWAYHLLKFLEDPADLIQLGLRESSNLKREKKWGKINKVSQFWPKNERWSKKDFEISLEKISNYLETQKIEEIYVSLDIDVLDSSFALAIENPSRGGLSPVQILKALDSLDKKAKITGADIVEIAPFVTNFKKNLVGDENVRDEPEKTIFEATSFGVKLLGLMNANKDR